jgi:hypothetical protein
MAAGPTHAALMRGNPPNRLGGVRDMSRSSAIAKSLAMALTLSVALVGIPVPAQTAQLSGNVYTGDGEAPLTGVTVYAQQPETGEIYSSQPTTDQGAFSIPDIPSGKVELGVAIDKGLYLVEPALTLAPAQSQHVNISVAKKNDDDTSGAAVVPASAKAHGWSNPLVAALIVVGGAVVIGLLIEAATDDDDNEQPGSGF